MMNYTVYIQSMNEYKRTLSPEHARSVYTRPRESIARSVPGKIKIYIVSLVKEQFLWICLTEIRNNIHEIRRQVRG